METIAALSWAGGCSQLGLKLSKAFPWEILPCPVFSSSPFQVLLMGLCKGKQRSLSSTLLSGIPRAQWGKMRKGFGKALGQFNQSLLFPSFQTYLVSPPCCSEAVFWPLGPPRSQGSESSERGQNLRMERSFKSYPVTFPFCRCGNTGTEERQDLAKAKQHFRGQVFFHPASSELYRFRFQRGPPWALPQLFTPTSPHSPIHLNHFYWASSAPV